MNRAKDLRTLSMGYQCEYLQRINTYRMGLKRRMRQQDIDINLSNILAIKKYKRIK